MIHKSILLLSLVVASLATGCTTRYQDMLRERDQRIRELSTDVANLRGENEELTRRATAQPVNAAATAKPESSSLVNEVQNEVGDGASVAYSRGGRISIGVQDSVTFDSGSTVLKDSSHKVLRNVANVLKNRFANRRFYIEGHTDDDPIQKTRDKFSSNRHLGALRADAVARYLIEQGVPERQIVLVSYGQYDPKDAKAKARNRRVEIVVGDPNGG
jgi:flagellar motor protein MotB